MDSMKLLRSDKNDIKNNWIYHWSFSTNSTSTPNIHSLMQIIGVGILHQSIIIEFKVSIL